MVDYLDDDGDGEPDEMDIRYFSDGQLRLAWFGVDLDDDGHYDAWFADPSGTGVWNERVPGPVPAGGPGVPAVGVGVHVKDGIAELVVDSGEGQRAVARGRDPTAHRPDGGQPRSDGRAPRGDRARLPRGAEPRAGGRGADGVPLAGVTGPLAVSAAEEEEQVLRAMGK